MKEPDFKWWMAEVEAAARELVDKGFGEIKLTIQNNKITVMHKKETITKPTENRR